jgi:hypothetical protein
MPDVCDGYGAEGSRRGGVLAKQAGFATFDSGI